MAETINIGGISRDMTSEEITELKEWQAEAQKFDDDLKTQQEKIDKDKASGNKKLKDLGLTDDEITALVG